MRRSGIALFALVTLLLAVGSGGPSALAIDSGPLSASPDPVQFGTQAVGITTTTRTVTISDDSSTLPLTILSVSASGDYSVPNGSDTCTGATLIAGQQCTVGVTFQPGSTGSDPGTLSITDDDVVDGASQNLDLTGSGVANQFSLSGPLTFGDQRVGTTSGNQAEIVTNATDYNADPGGSNASGDFSASGCGGGVIGGGGTCTINVSFTPTATGTRTGTLSIGAGGSVGLTGSGVSPNAILAPGSFDFGNQPMATQSGTTTLTLSNNGTSPLNYTSTDVTGANIGDFSVSDANCAATVTIAPSNWCTITVQFIPTATGTRTATVNVHDDDPGTPTQHVSLQGTGTPSSVGFAPSTVTFVTPIPAGTASPVHLVTVTNMTNSTMPITGTSFVGANPQNFVRSADTCTGANLPANGTCTIRVAFTPSSAGLRTALLQVTDNGSVGPHAHQVTLTGHATYPNNPKSVRGSVGCSASRIKWVAPTATRFATTVVVRNHARYPTNPGDGTIVPHTAGIARDKGLRHFTTYYYRVFAKYHSLTHVGKVNYSQGVRLKERTGEICTPQNGARLHDLTPTVTWLPSPTQNGYAFVLQHGSQTIWINYTRKTQWHISSSWRYHASTHRLLHGRSYTLYLYAYPASHPNGVFIGKVSFTVL